MWTDHPSLPGILVSDDGRIARVIPDQDSQGYRRINYPRTLRSKAPPKRSTLVHRLVAETFLGPAEGRDVNHIDGNPANNELANLEYVSRRENYAHAYNVLGRRGAAKLSADQVREIRALPKMSLSAAAALYGVSPITISRIRRGVYYKMVG